MTYRVSCEVMSRDPNIAAYASMPVLHWQVFIQPQEAVDFARVWVRDFDNTDIPANLQPQYSSLDLPRASVSRQGKFKGHPVIFNCWRKSDGEICERRNA